MDAHTDPHREQAERLRTRIARSLALDDAMAAELCFTAAALAAEGDREGAEALIAAGRRHRVGAIKHRALMSAHGIDV